MDTGDDHIPPPWLRLLPFPKSAAPIQHPFLEVLLSVTNDMPILAADRLPLINEIPPFREDRIKADRLWSSQLGAKDSHLSRWLFPLLRFAFE
jgi:hypothetical protein